MPSVRIPESLREELAKMDLTIWIAMHPMTYENHTAFENGRGREDRTRVQVQLAGPGLEDYSPWGHGATIYEAVRAALEDPAVAGRVPGLRGAMLRLEIALSDLQQAILRHRWTQGGDHDDEIPF